MTQTEYDILGKIGVERHHCNGIKCTKTLINNRWEGDCIACKIYQSLWKQNLTDEARRIKPVERHHFATTGEPLSCGKSVAEIIGDRTGRFMLVKSMKGQCRSQPDGWPYYGNSYFVKRTA